MHPRWESFELNHTSVSAALLLDVLPLNLEDFGSEGTSQTWEKITFTPGTHTKPTRKKQEIGAGIQAVENHWECGLHFRRAQGRPVVSTAAADIS